MPLPDCRVLRLDLVHPLAGGNKWYKLRYNLQGLQPGERILSFGGAWSNHLHALAAVGAELGLETHAVVRGERPETLSDTLQDALDMGMVLHFVSRGEYRRRHDADYQAGWQARLAPCRLVPEGGANLAGARGCQEILSPTLLADTDLVALACGTGTTLAGIAAALEAPRRALGVSVLRGDGGMRERVKHLLAQLGAGARDNWRVEQRFHGGGYARVAPELRDFMLEFEQRQGFALDPVYTGKLFYALYRLRASGELAPGTRILALHSGGLQGRRGFDWLPEGPAGLR